MKLKPQPPLRRRTSRTSRSKRAGRSFLRRGGGRQAIRPTASLRRRLSTRLPSIRRLLAGVGGVAVAAGLVALLMGPWLRVGEVSWEGERFTPSADLAAVLETARGVSALAVDTAALRADIERLPAVADATVTVSLTGTVQASVVEREAAFVWGTRLGFFVGAADGTLIAGRAAEGELDPSLAGLPFVSDTRASARVLAIGDVVPEALVQVVLRLAELDPALLGSDATDLAITLDDDYGFRLLSTEQSWEIAFGVYGRDPHETIADARARLDRQVTAVRTLFAARPEAELAWVDVRNPGKVYFRAKG
ncbi:MAG TPA: FtsQ-type POTRA domain-containing protein [Candidatus Limnocylindria bacterium]